ncbi:hypothetical protein CPB86DRAFT_298178 [Serendipita vermifera]|nr:hypothetical protein CPB86DRAFT_298178 [Serendipita vermifera]
MTDEPRRSLHTRRNVDDKLPSWMLLYGIIYGDSGFIIQEHYPVYHRRSQRGDPSSQFGWGAISFPASNCVETFLSPPAQRARPLAALQRVVDNAQNLLQKLSAWDGYKRILSSHLRF